MTEDDERTIRSLEFRLSRALDDCRRAQKALTAARHRLGIYGPQLFFDAADMDRERAESRLELREMMKAVISDCRARWDRSYVPTPLEAAMQKWPAAFKAALDAKEAKAPANVVTLTAEQIIAAGKRRRGES